MAEVACPPASPTSRVEDSQLKGARVVGLSKRQGMLTRGCPAWTVIGEARKSSGPGMRATVKLLQASLGARPLAACRGTVWKASRYLGPRYS